MKTNVNFAAEKQEISNMESMTLSSGSLLKHGEYRIGRVLGQGGFGITYEAEQIARSDAFPSTANQKQCK